MNVLLFDNLDRDNLLPLTFTRPMAEIRCGILTITEKWNKYLSTSCSFITQPYLQKKFPSCFTHDNYFINAGFLPNNELVTAIQALENNQALCSMGTIIAVRTSENTIAHIDLYEQIAFTAEVYQIRYPWNIFTYNANQINSDFEIITYRRISEHISESNKLICPENIFIEEGARLECATINATHGKVYIGKDAEVMEGALIRGPFALCEHATVKMAAKIYEGTTIGPYCKIGGEVQNSVIFGFSNKGHDGYLGNSVLGEWCNLGADTNNSNLKNDYSEVKVWNYSTERFMKTGLQFCGLIMGDHSKSAINTMFNTGTVVGVSSNVFGSGFPRNFFPSFSWGGAEGMQEYQLKKASDTAMRVYARRGKEFDANEQSIFEAIFEQTQKFRRY